MSEDCFDLDRNMFGERTTNVKQLKTNVGYNHIVRAVC